ncbi:MAG: LON peptidase substrate-binding domain-containing protein [Chloroflexota bacterium]
MSEDAPLPEDTDLPSTPPHDLSTTLPDELTLLPLLNMVIYPLTVTPLAVGQEWAVRLIDETIAAGGMLGMVALTGTRRPERLTPQDFFHIGTAAAVHRMVRLHDNTLRVAVEGIARFEVVEVLQTEPRVVARVRPLPDEAPNPREREEARALVATAEALARRLPAQGATLLEELAAEADPARLSYLAAARLLPRSGLDERQQMLALTRTAERLERMRRILERDLAALGPGEEGTGGQG